MNLNWFAAKKKSYQRSILFLRSVLNLERLISISNMDTFKFVEKGSIPETKLSMYGMTAKGYPKFHNTKILTL